MNPDIETRTTAAAPTMERQERPRRGTNRGKLSSQEIEEILGSSGFEAEPPYPYRAAQLRLVRHGGRMFKVRAYRNSEEARQRLMLMDQVRDLFVPCYGRRGRYAIFEYVGKNLLHQCPDIPERIGAFLAELANIEAEPLADEEFDLWCRMLEDAKIFRPRTLDFLKRHYHRIKSPPLRWTLYYGDAMPRNFVFTEDAKFLCIDEKHLRIAPDGLNLVLAEWRFPAQAFAKLKETYTAKAGTAQLESAECSRRILFYFCVAEMAYRLTHARPSKLHGQKEVHRERRLLLMIAGAGWWMRFSESLRWDPRFRMWRSWALLRRHGRAFGRRCAVLRRWSGRLRREANDTVVCPGEPLDE